MTRAIPKTRLSIDKERHTAFEVDTERQIDTEYEALRTEVERSILLGVQSPEVIKLLNTAPIEHILLLADECGIEFIIRRGNLIGYKEAAV